MKNLDKILIECLATTRAAGQILSNQWHKPRKIEHKGAIDLVTDTDKEIEAFLKEKLAALVPDAAFLGEESSANMDKLLSSSLCWVVDPVDGTTNFVHYLPMVAVSVALCQNGEPIIGVVDAPLLRETYYAARDTRAFCNGEPVSVSTTYTLTDSLVATGFPYDMSKALPGILKRLERVLPVTQGLRRPGSAALDLCWTAAGRVDAFYEEDLKPWDMAAGWLLVKEAGGEVTDFSGAPLEWHKPVLASNGHVHMAMVELLNSRN